MTKVLFSAPIKDAQLEELKGNFPQVEFLLEKDQPREQLLAQADIWVTFGLDIKKGEVEKAPRLKWIMTYAAGVDKLPADEIIKKNIQVTNVSGIHRHVIAEHAFGYMIYYARNFAEYGRQQKGGEWDWSQGKDPLTLYGKTLGIIGVGAIGKEIARKAKAFDMKVLGLRRSGKQTEFVDQMFPMKELYSVLEKSDYVVAVLPGTPETKHMMNKEAFSKMKRNGYFINVGRGEVVDTDDLVWALQEKKIAGAGLDVFEQEPLPKDHVLRNMDNVFITPHMAGRFPEYNARANDIFSHNLQVYLNKAGEMMNVVDLTIGY